MKEFLRSVAEKALVGVLVGIAVAGLLAIPVKSIVTQLIDAITLKREIHPGTIVAFWGSTIPDGYEICDGDRVTTPRSPINGKRKPNLIGTFVRGAATVNEDLDKLARGGATNVMITPDNLPYIHYSDDVGPGGPRTRLVGRVQNDNQQKPVELLPPFQDVVYLIRVL